MFEVLWGLFLFQKMTSDALKSFKQIWKEKFNQDISDDFAIERAEKLIRMVELIYKPMTEKEFNLVQERRKQTGDI